MGNAARASGNMNTPLVAHPNGAVVPADEPAVAAARAQHLASKNAARAAANVNTPLVAHPNGAVVPADEPAVAAARANHLASIGAVYAASAPVIVPSTPYPTAPYAAPPSVAAPYVAAPYAAAPFTAVPYSGQLNPNNQLVAHPTGAVVPIDNPAVAAARTAHLASKEAAYVPAVY